METQDNKPTLPVFTAEFLQRVLYGEYFNGVDQPLKTVIQVKIERSWTAEQQRRQATGVQS